MKQPPKDDPDYSPVDKKYDQLGPGGRTGPKDPVVRSEYAEAKGEEEGLVSDSVIVWLCVLLEIEALSCSDIFLLVNALTSYL